MGQGGGEVATGVAGHFKDMALGAGEGSEDDEYLITSFTPHLNVINCYGEQRKTKIEEVMK